MPPESTEFAQLAHVPGPSLDLAGTERALAQLWADVLELADCPRQESFMALGGDSISATQLLSRVRDQFQIQLPLELMFEHMSIERMAELIARQRSLGDGPSGLPSITRQPRDLPLPLSHCQRRMWLVQQFAPETTAYNVPFALRLTGALDRAHLQQAVEAVWSRHEVFRTRFTMTPQGLMQSLTDSPGPVHLTEADFSSHREDEQLKLANALLLQVASTPFDMADGPLWRCHLLRLNDHDHILAWVAHHIIVDLWANLVLAQELGQAYTAVSQGLTPELKPHPIDCADHAHWQASPEVSKHLAPQLGHWLDQLKELTPLALPTDHPATPDWHESGGRITRMFKTSTLNALAQRAASSGHSPFMIMLACLNVLLARQTRQTDIAIATPIANRQHPDTEHIVASLVNTLVMRTEVSGSQTFQQVLDRVKATALQAYAHQDLPFDLLVEKLGHAHRQHDTPLGLSVMFNASNAMPGQFQFKGLQARRFQFARGATQFPLSLVVDTDRTQSIFLEYADKLFDAATAEALLDNYLSLLDQVLARPDAPLSSLRWLSLAERARLHAWNQATTPAIHGDASVSALLHARAQQQPHAVAIRFKSQIVTYGELEMQARHIAQSLRDQGIGRGHRVGICLERGPNLLASVWAVWMTAAAYVPLDPAYPAERLQFMAADAKLSLVITHQTLESRLEWPPGLRLLLDHAVSTTIKDKAPPDIQAQGHDPAYVIYTSGSTGQPKGVIIPHRAVVNFLESMAQAPGLSAQDRLLAVTTLSFDISVLELMLPLTVGAQIVMASHDDVLDGHALKALIEQHQVNVMQATPSTWRLLMEAGWTRGPTPAGFKALVGGEPLNHDLATQLLSRADQVWNMYGPTETTVWSTCWQVRDPSAGIRIGRPIANTQVWVLDEHGHPCPIGVPGEIVIGGDGVAMGYWERDDLTRERFIPNPFSDQAGARLYRTGDLGRWLWSGDIEHLGRLDFQIKVRGHRIEPGEIETQLTRHPGVAQALVIAREDTPGDVRLVAYIVPRQAMPSRAVLREHARHCLPDHMQPQHYVELASVPLLANGKVNRQALPAPAMASHEPEHASPSALSTDTQKLLALIWQELLGAQHIQPDDNFFNLGGHSLLAVQAIAKMEKVTGKRVSARRYIFENLAQLASSYDQTASVAEPAAAPPPAPGLLQRWLGRKRKP
ncbi:amino acid adenylation domain-containing protein [Aquabacterium sp.]|uniref:non-ribosomal peptide synthetase n=1 Tax=Aquabacterium sp. TaxID=1872578 RepID=UPI003D6CF7D4